jgi:hypothetical protein
VLVLRLRALIACARGDADASLDFVEQYPGRAEPIGLDRHIAMAEAMPIAAGDGG